MFMPMADHFPRRGCRLAEAQGAGAVLCARSAVAGGRLLGGGAGRSRGVALHVKDTQSGEVMELRASHVVNSAGGWGWGGSGLGGACMACTCTRAQQPGAAGRARTLAPGQRTLPLPTTLGTLPQACRRRPCPRP